MTRWQYLHFSNGEKDFLILYPSGKQRKIQRTWKLVSALWWCIFIFTTLFLFSMGTVRAEEKITIGALEEVILLPWGVRLPARIDTGAATSSLDARGLKVRDNIVEFKLPEKYGDLRFHLPVVMWHDIRGAEFKGRRPAIEVTICIGSKTLRVHVTLNDRSMVEYPLIMGRNVLQNNFVVDVSRAKTAPPNCPDDKSCREYWTSCGKPGFSFNSFGMDK